MSAITLEQAQARLQEYLVAEAAALEYKTIEINGRRYQHEDLPAIQHGVKIWSRLVETLSETAAGRRRSVNVSPGW